MICLAAMSPISTLPFGAGSSAPSKPLTRRPTLVRKREDEGDEIIPSSPGKRAKVTFDSDVEVRLMPEVQDPPHIIQEEVRQAFEKRKWGDVADYDRLKEIYAPTEDGDQESPEVIKKHTLGLLSNISQLNKDTADFVRGFINSKWLAMSDEYVSVYVRVLANLLSGQGMFTGEALQMLVQNLSLSKMVRTR